MKWLRGPDLTRRPQFGNPWYRFQFGDPQWFFPISFGKADVDLLLVMRTGISQIHETSIGCAADIGSYKNNGVTARKFQCHILYYDELQPGEWHMLVIGYTV